ncbi:unnamed protein product [Effrenium voratum]|uniref:Uncharacterized protein n=1 Tax=Effrenium voratum TaxID=2562239 RepID=A0AA36MH77_9DINO|nr:unnamed protein product [Effrenium voratum]
MASSTLSAKGWKAVIGGGSWWPVTSSSHLSWRSAAHLAARSGHAEALRLLHNHGCEMEAMDRFGRTALHLACEHGKADVVKVLLDCGARPGLEDKTGRNALHLAACCEDPSLCETLASQFPQLVFCADSNGRTPLFYAALNAHPQAQAEVTKMLLQNSANINHRDCHGKVALHHAAEEGQLTAVRLLLKNKIDANAQDKEKQTALQMASSEAVSGPGAPSQTLSKVGLKEFLAGPSGTSPPAAPDQMRLMLEVDMEATELGKLVLSEGASERLQAFGKTIRDTFAAKATATIYKRTRCYWRFFTWCRAVQAGNGLRLSEKVVYKYLSYLQEEGAGATSGDAFLQSFRFFHASWQFVGLNLDQELSARVKGVAHVLYCKKPLLKQARALSVAELAALEDIVLGAEASHVGVIAGYLLFCAMSCCRFSDALFAIDFVVSSHGSTVLIEAGTKVHKTASSKEKKTVLLPLVALGKVFRSDSWAKKWFSLRQACVPKNIRFVLPAYSEQSGRWLNRAMTTAEGILWMQDIMSWKCTTFHGHATKEDLGSSRGPRKFFAAYIWAGQCGCHKVQVAAMLQRIKAGRFDPDEARVAFVDRQIASFCAEIDKSDEHLHYGDLDAVDASDVEDADEAEAEAHESKAALRIFLPEATSDSRIMQHLA